jgi:acyl-coenzyme A thioesterase PaaI-like protein
MVFFEIGSGVAGYPGVCHGGFVATMLDECMGILLNVNQLYKNLKSGIDGPLSHMTGLLNVNYKSPVPTPGIILATAKISRQEGRKIWIEGTLQDSERKILATSDSLFITTNRSPVANGKL